MDFYDSLHRFVSLASLVLTPATIILSLAVVIVWLDSAKRALFSREKNSVQWLILGVSIGFVGSIVDNAYWGVAWTADFLGHSSRDQLFKNGVYSNAPFRQLCTIAAAACHVKAGVDSHNIFFKFVVISAGLSGVFVAVALLIHG